MITAILAPIVVFGLVIFVHELGHFIAAKSVGVYAPRFSIGFGPALWRKRKGETEYILAALPLGGYVRMASRHDEATAFLEGGSEEALAEKLKNEPGYDPEAMIPFGPKPVPEHRWFESKPLWARMYILLAGVTMNFILGLVVAIGLVMYYGTAVIPTRVVGAVRPINGQDVLGSSIHVGDTIIAVNGSEVRTWDAAAREIAASTSEVSIRTNRGEFTVPLDRPGAPSGRDVAAAMSFHLPPVIGEVLPGGAADRAGLEPGDSVAAIDGRPIPSWNAMVGIISDSPDRELAFDIVRDGSRETLRITPRPTRAEHPVTGVASDSIGRIGAGVIDVTGRERVPMGRSISIGARTTWLMGTSIVTTVKDLVTRKVSVDQLGGPIAITRASVAAARSGMENFFYLIALLSINVAILNLLPIPILDGGQILINVLESARGRAFSLKTREYILRGGLFVILLLFVLVMFNDTKSLLLR